MGKKLYRLLGVLLAFFLVVSAFPTAVHAQAVRTDIEVLLDGKKVDFDVQPQMIQYRTYVPFRKILEAMGAQVWWDEASQTAYAEKNGVQIRMTLGSDKIYRNGVPIQMDVAVLSIDYRTMIPMRFASEALGAQVTWQEATPTTPFYVFVKSTGPIQGQAANVEVINGDGKVPAQKLDQIKSILPPITRQASGEFGFSYSAPVKMYVVSDKIGYQTLLISHGYPSTRASMLAEVSAGLAKGNNVYIPLYAYASDSQMNGTVAHEMVHILFNQNGLGYGNLPSWLNEGLSERFGMQVEYEGKPSVMLESHKKWLNDYILDIKQGGKLIPLLSSSEETISNLANYDVEVQDWLAAERLISQNGFEKVKAYLNYLIDQRSPSYAFSSAFSTSPETFEAGFNSFLDQQMQRADRGVRLSFQVTDAFRGSFMILPKGQVTWRSYTLAPGIYTVTILPDGTVQGLTATRTAKATGEAEADNMYIGIVPDANVLEGGKMVDFAGFAMKYGFGEYFLMNAWLSNTDGTTSYPETNKVLGIELLSVQSL